MKSLITLITLITGCPRSATKYTCILLENCNKDYPHEDKIGKDGLVSWLLNPTIQNDVKIHQFLNFKKITEKNGKEHFLKRTFHHAPVPTEDLKKQFKILHQVRHPLSTINSLCKLREKSWEWAASFCPIELKASKILRGMQFWYYWNLMAEEQASWTFKIESLENPEIYNKFCQELDIDIELFLKALETTPKNINKRFKGTKLTWENLKNNNEELYEKIREMSGRYGY